MLAYVVNSFDRDPFANLAKVAQAIALWQLLWRDGAA